MAEAKKPFHETVAENLIEQLKAGTAPWQRPWEPGEPGGFLPFNPTTGKRYKGINAIHLMSQGRTDNRWMTYKQAAAAGAQVRKGEKGTPVQYWKFSEEQEKRDEHGKPVLDGDGEPVKQSVMLERPRVFFATVFNAEQIEGLPLIERKEQTWDAVERAEHILKASGAVIRHGENNRAFYRPATDSIHLPDRGQFQTADNYYATALHELGHWTGHASRLDRDLVHPFGSEGYAKEELRAEITSMIVGDELGIGHDPGQHAAYVGSWIKALEDDPLEIFRASAEAEKIKDYVMAFEQQQVQEQGQGQSQAHEEATVAQALAVDIVEVLNDPALTFSHYEALQGATLEEALRSRGLTTVGSVTGHDPGQFWEKAHDRLSPVFGINPEHSEMGAPYLERKGLVQAFTLKAEQLFQIMQQGQEASMQQAPQQEAAPDVAEAWTMGHLERGTLAHALDTANLAQIERATNVLNAMQPLNTQNKFWTRHELPADVDALDAQIEAVIEPVEQLLREARVAEVRKMGDMGAFDVAASDVFDLPPKERLPHDWNGVIQVQANAEHEVDGEWFVAAAADLGVAPEFWSVYTQRADGRFEVVKDFDTPKDAEQLAYRLAVVVANSTDNEHERDAILARAHEDRVRRDPSSTDEDISAAKEARKAAEMNATLNDADMQKRIAELEQQQKQAADRHAQDERTYLDVPYKEKDEAKALGARWDRKEQSWYVPSGVDAAPFAKWAQGAAQARTADMPAQDQGAGQKAAQERVYLAVPYGERGAAKAAGAAWDKAAKSWYVGPKADMEKLQRWFPDNVPAQQAPAMSPREEFADALRSMGCDVNGEHPNMDGAKHRIGVEGDKKGEQAGFYVGHLDGHPAGYIKNNRTGIEMKWKSKGYSLDPQKKAKLAAEAASKLVARAEEQDRLHEASAQRVGKQMADLVPVGDLTPYMRNKGIQAHTGVFTDKDGQKTYIPAFDVDGKQWTMQYIQDDGTKRFAKDSKKEGCFHPVGGMDALAQAPALVLSEGYATAATNAEALGFATVAAFDSGNLPAVAQALHEKFPDKPVIILGDDDRQLELTQGVNSGRLKAQEAAKAVDGKAFFPIFAPGENAYPAALAPITPHIYREHLRATKALEDAQKDPEGGKLTEQQTAELKRAQLSDKQLAALEQMKAHTDFNDLATRSALGREGVERQVKAEVGRVIREAEEKRERTQAQEKKHVQEHEQKPRRTARIA
ncbi:zincin-like metallopeptidase domain-containing protein [Azoarcus sp. PA01]|nr:zincin-like metallopeptidase domain-containing protein [Azoarcus sp. PA01]KON82622.1 zincin-like metallopeptidase domain-containing protein [Azoarcus sp. PA01]